MTIINPHTGQVARVFHLPNYKHEFRRRDDGVGQRAAQPFDYPTVLSGKTKDGLVSVYIDTGLPQAGASALGLSLLEAAPKVVADGVSWFGIKMQPVNVIIADLGGSQDGLGGAYHYGCDFLSGGDLYLDAALQVGGSQMETGLLGAELFECFMGAQAKGWNCGGSGGEALSRCLAELESGGPEGALKDFVSAPSWDKAGRPNWIDTDQGTDQDYPSIGCGMVYLSWLMTKFSVAAIVQAGELHGTLEDNYHTLTKSDNSGWNDMTAALKGITIVDDDPFGGIAEGGSGSPPAPQPAPTPQPTPEPTPAPAGTPITKAMLLKALAGLPD